MLKFFPLFFLFFFTHPGFCQGELEKEPLSPNGGKVIIKGASAPADSAPAAVSAPAPQTAQIQPTPALTQDEVDRRDLDELNRVQNTQRTQFQQVDKAIDPLRNPLNPIEELKRLSKGQLTAATLLDEKFLKLLRETFKEGLLSGLPREEVKSMLKIKTQGNLIGMLYESYPVWLEISVDLLRDKIVFTGLVDLLLRKDDLKDYGIVVIIIFLIGLFIKHRLVKPTWPFFRRFRWKLAINICLNVVTFYVFYYMFSLELDPILRIINSHLKI